MNKCFCPEVDESDLILQKDGLVRHNYCGGIREPILVKVKKKRKNGTVKN